MGFVFQAHDAQTGLPVALKMLHGLGNAEAARRFAREAQVLASLRHPGIVSYVAHGLTEEDQPFLAMEWLEGEDLAHRLTHNPLSLSESLQLLRRAADALAAAHAQGIIHRDLKPSNLFLRAGQPRDVVLLDFGLARHDAVSQPLTGSAMVVGTPGYMAPEQASSQQDVSPAADVFSLGCVLYECLTGQPPFRAMHLAAVLAKILFSEPAPLRSVRPELPASLQALVERMLIKQPAQRISDAGQLLRALEALEAPLELPPPGRATASAPPESAHAERHLVSVLLATPALHPHEAATLQVDELARDRKLREPLLQELESQGARAALLADGSLLATFLLERGTATDQAVLAANGALFVKEQWPDSFVALTTGLSLRGHSLPIGEAVDRAGELLLHQKARTTAPAPQVLVDDTTAGLIGSRFQLEKTPSGLFLLHGKPLSVDESRPLLGRPTPCVGREQELALLELTFTSCVEDSAARALLVIAPAGTGKSRLRHELLRRLERHAQPPLVLLGRGDPMHTSAAHGLVGQAVRRLCDVVDGEPLEARRARLAQRLSWHLPPEQHKEVTEFLGELCAIPFPGEDSPRLRAAREDPQLMNAQVTRALVCWLKAECAQRPVVLMLEDLHWSDGPSINLVEQVLRELSEHPLLVVALARPEVKELFPGLWAGRLQEVPLRGLSQKASARLVQEVLGPQLPEVVVARLVGQAAGNALFLEELIRGVAEGHGEETPGSVLAMLQSRLQRLEPEARRVVMAASIFGRTFWQGGVSALEPGLSSEELTRWLRRLVALELVQLQPGSRFPAEAEYRFHHALVRDAAYGLLPDDLRSAGHLRAGEWLEAAGESSPLVLAEHYKLGGQKQKAIHFFTRACRQNCERQSTDLQGAQRCLKAALECEPTGPALTELQVLEADIAFWMQDTARTIAVSEEVLPKLVEGSPAWIQVVGNLIMTHALCGRPGEAATLGQRLLGIEPAPEDIASYTEAISFACAIHIWGGQRQESLAVVERVAQLAKQGLERDNLTAHGWWCINWGSFEYYSLAHPWQCRQVAEDGVRSFTEVGAEMSKMVPLALLGHSLAALGEMSRAAEVLREGLESSRAFVLARAYLLVHMCMVLSGSSEREHQEEAALLALQAREVVHANPLYLGLATLALARVALAQGSHAEAEALAREACTLTAGLLVFQIMARTCLSAALLGQGRPMEARVEAEQATRLLGPVGEVGALSVGAWLALSEACQAQGDDAAAEASLRRALDCLRLRAKDLPDAEALGRFLSQVPENARALRLADERDLPTLG
jgi:hypothetical protein